MFNPIAVMTGFGDRFVPMLVEVTGKETIVADRQAVECFVLEAANARAWVDARGAVRVQEVTLPMLGKLRIVRETTYDDEARRSARRKRFVPGGGHRP